MTPAFVRFVLNYIRDQFDTNDEGAKVAYFELLSDIGNDEVRQMIRIYKQRSRWPEYPHFPQVLERVRDEMGGLK